MAKLNLYAQYSRKDVHDILSPDTLFTQSSGTWGLHGIIEIPGHPGDFVFFVTFGQHQADHTFDEWITEQGVIFWQSQPRQSFEERRIQQFIHHDDKENSIYLFLRTQRNDNYTYLGKLRYLAHDPVREKPVYMYWQLLDWPIPSEILSRINLQLQPANTYIGGASPIMRSNTDYSQEIIYFIWGGKRWYVNRQELFSRIRDWIVSGLPEEATRYKNWYIDIDGHCISPKWLFHLITGARYNEFDAPTAREKLSKVGISTIQVLSTDELETTNQTNIAPINPARVKPPERRVFFERITKYLTKEIPETFTSAKYHIPNFVNWFEIRFPKIKGYFSLRLARQFDEFAYFFAGSTPAAELFAQQLVPYLPVFSEKMECPVTVSSSYWQTWGRLGFELPPGLVSKSDEQNPIEIAYARKLGRFIQVTYPQLVTLLKPRSNPPPPEKATSSKNIQPQIQILEVHVDSIRQVLSGSIDIPSDEMLCDWIHFCYDFGLYKEGQMLFSFVTSEHVNPWYYERTKKLARLCSIRLAAKD
jgi:hypothetical protein